MWVQTRRQYLGQVDKADGGDRGLGDSGVLVNVLTASSLGENA